MTTSVESKDEMGVLVRLVLPFSEAYYEFRGRTPQDWDSTLNSLVAGSGNRFAYTHPNAAWIADQLTEAATANPQSRIVFLVHKGDFSRCFNIEPNTFNVEAGRTITIPPLRDDGSSEVLVPRETTDMLGALLGMYGNGRIWIVAFNRPGHEWFEKAFIRSLKEDSAGPILAAVERQLIEWDGPSGPGGDVAMSVLPALAVLCQGYLVAQAGPTGEPEVDCRSEAGRKVVREALGNMGWIEAMKSQDIKAGLAQCLIDESDAGTIGRVELRRQVDTSRYWDVFDDQSTILESAKREWGTRPGSNFAPVKALISTQWPSAASGDQASGAEGEQVLPSSDDRELMVLPMPILVARAYSELAARSGGNEWRLTGSVDVTPSTTIG